MILSDGRDVKLHGPNFLVNIALPEFDKNGLKVISRDPRKQRIKPACYVGKVEEVGETCKYVKTGDTVVFERWQWKQWDVDDERLVAREKELVILDQETPMWDIIVLQLFDIKTPVTKLALPGTLWGLEDKPYHHGIIQHLPGKHQSTVINGVEMKLGDELIVERYDTGQYLDGQGRLFFRLGAVAQILLYIERQREPAAC